jgi:hypothetical protein
VIAGFSFHLTSIISKPAVYVKENNPRRGFEPVLPCRHLTFLMLISAGAAVIFLPWQSFPSAAAHFRRQKVSLLVINPSLKHRD